MAQGMKADRAKFWTGFFKDFYGVGLLAQPVSAEVLEWSRDIPMQASLKATLDCASAFATTARRTASWPRTRIASQPMCSGFLPIGRVSRDQPFRQNVCCRRWLRPAEGSAALMGRDCGFSKVVVVEVSIRR